MSYLGYLYLLVHSGVQHILCCGYVLFCFSSSILPDSLDCQFLLPLRYSLMFIHKCVWTLLKIDVSFSNLPLNTGPVQITFVLLIIDLIILYSHVVSVTLATICLN